jgi:caffeoyl-CoA O-methyltransferase
MAAITVLRCIATASFVALLSPVHVHGRDLDDLKSAQEKFEAAFQTRDVETIVDLLHPQFVDFPVDGELPRNWVDKTAEQRRAFFRESLAQYESWEVRLVDVSYEVIGTTGVVSGWERVTRKPRGGVLEYPRWRFTSTWVKLEGKWLMAGTHRSTTPATAPGAAPLAGDPNEERILQVALETPRWANVPMADARLLRVLTEASDAKHVVELGTSTGFSALWICNALRKNRGRLTTFEIDAQRAAIARQAFKRAGVEDLVTIVEGDAHRNLKQLEGPVDLVFIDADKDGYFDYLQTLLPLVRPGGLIIAHNMRWPAPSPNYVNAVTGNAALETVFVNMDDQGIGVTLKKR